MSVRLMACEASGGGGVSGRAKGFLGKRQSS